MVAEQNNTTNTSMGPEVSDEVGHAIEYQSIAHMVGHRDDVHKIAAVNLSTNLTGNSITLFCMKSDTLEFATVGTFLVEDSRTFEFFQSYAERREHPVVEWILSELSETESALHENVDGFVIIAVKSTSQVISHEKILRHTQISS